MIDATAIIILLFCLYLWVADKLKQRDYTRACIEEDTCQEHGVFCCADCFNMDPYGGE